MQKNKNFKKKLLFTFLVIPFSITGCVLKPSSQNNNQSLSVKRMPRITTYEVGESLYLGGLLIADKDDGYIISNYLTSPESGYVFSNEDIGDKIIEVSKVDYKPTSFTIKVIEASNISDIDEYKSKVVDKMLAYYTAFDLSEYSEDNQKLLEDIVNEFTSDVLLLSLKEEIDQLVLETRNKLEKVETIEDSESEIKTIDIYATNDIHGQVEAQNNRLSLGVLTTFLKDKGNNKNTLLLDQGDTWQGSIYSNYNYGALITDVMNYIHYDARTIGNHDFDWGVSYLIANTAREYDGYRTPVLAANVYDYNFATKQVGNTQQSEIGIKSISYTLENGLKVGIVGCIGQNQITTITSHFVRDLTFINQIDVIKEEATKLRNEGCHIVISSNHCGQEDLLGYGLDKYVDLVLCSHTHKREETTENGLLYAQFGSYSQYVGHITLEYNSRTKKVSYLQKEAVSAALINNQISIVDPQIDEIITTYKNECDQEANVVVASNVNGSFYSTEQLPNLMCQAIYDRAVEEGYDIDLAYCNQARISLYNHEWTYADLYQAFPFDNTIYITDITYDEMKDEIACFNNICCSPDFNRVVDRNKKYRIACTDYLLLHTNSRRYYDYFSDTKGSYIAQLSTHYRFILRDWFINNGYDKGKSLSAYSFSSSETSYNKSFTFN